MSLPLKIKRAKRYKVSRKGMGGVPELYKPDYCKKIVKFFSKDPYEIRTMPDGTIKHRANDLATFEEFAVIKLGVTTQTLRDWQKRHPEFLEACEKCRQLQKRFLIVNGAKGIINSSYSKFLAVNLTDLRDKVEVEQTNHFPEGINVSWSQAPKEIKDN